MAFHVELEFASRTDTGMVRSHNEDALAISTRCGFAILADGMGGYNAGEVASGIATSVLKETLEERLLKKTWDSRFNRSRRLHQILTESIAHTNASIIEAARIEPSYTGMGTTLVAALFHYDKVTIAHIGDSRIYRFREKQLAQLTRDHSLLQEQIDAGLLSEEEAPFAQNRNLITRAMGVDLEVDADMQDYLIQPNDIYLLCSDGLSDMVVDDQIAKILFNNENNMDAASALLVETAKLSGGRDNITVVLIKVKVANPMAKSYISRFKAWIK
ncbi:MAG: Stp1/IreP family PP2C-type Ser/Thr phosphatase [Burkholderiaceae bacterium]